MAKRRIDPADPYDASMLGGHRNARDRISGEAGGVGLDPGWPAGRPPRLGAQGSPGAFERSQWEAIYANYSVERLEEERDSLDDEQEANSRSSLPNSFRDGMTRMKQELVAARLKELRGY